MSERKWVYREVQRNKLIVTFGYLSLAFLVLLTFGLVRQIGYGIPLGNHPASNGGLVLSWLLVGLGLPVLLFSIRLDVRVQPVEGEGILLIRYTPFKTRRIPLATICLAEPCEYRPMRDYFGWGIRPGPGGWAYTARGNKAVRLMLADGERLLVGSGDPDELARAIMEQATR